MEMNKGGERSEGSRKFEKMYDSLCERYYECTESLINSKSMIVGVFGEYLGSKNSNKERVEMTCSNTLTTLCSYIEMGNSLRIGCVIAKNNYPFIERFELQQEKLLQFVKDVILETEFKFCSEVFSRCWGKRDETSVILFVFVMERFLDIFDPQVYYSKVASPNWSWDHGQVSPGLKKILNLYFLQVFKTDSSILEVVLQFMSDPEPVMRDNSKYLVCLSFQKSKIEERANVTTICSINAMMNALEVFLNLCMRHHTPERFIRKKLKKKYVIVKICERMFERFLHPTSVTFEGKTVEIPDIPHSLFSGDVLISLFYSFRGKLSIFRRIPKYKEIMSSLISQTSFSCWKYSPVRYHHVLYLISNIATAVDLTDVEGFLELPIRVFRNILKTKYTDLHDLYLSLVFIERSLCYCPKTSKPFLENITSEDIKFFHWMMSNYKGNCEKNGFRIVHLCVRIVSFLMRNIPKDQDYLANYGKFEPYYHLIVNQISGEGAVCLKEYPKRPIRLSEEMFEFFEPIHILMSTQTFKNELSGKENGVDTVFQFHYEIGGTDTNINLVISHCSFCGKSDGCQLKRCASCRKVAYCSTECQKKDWKRDHRNECKRSGEKEKIDEGEGIGICANCGKKSKKSLKKCSRCKSVEYCGRPCQLEDWKKHKSICIIVKKRDG